MGEPEQAAEDRRQVNVRLPSSLIAAIDARRADIRNADGSRGVSRDKWMERAARYALDKPRPATTSTGPGQRTAR